MLLVSFDYNRTTRVACKSHLALLIQLPINVMWMLSMQQITRPATIPRADAGTKRDAIMQLWRRRLASRARSSPDWLKRYGYTTIDASDASILAENERVECYQWEGKIEKLAERERARERLRKGGVKETYLDSEWEFYMINVKKQKIQCIDVDLLVNRKD